MPERMAGDKAERACHACMNMHVRPTDMSEGRDAGANERGKEKPERMEGRKAAASKCLCIHTKGILFFGRI